MHYIKSGMRKMLKIIPPTEKKTYGSCRTHNTDVMNIQIAEKKWKNIITETHTEIIKVASVRGKLRDNSFWLKWLSEGLIDDANCMLCVPYEKWFICIFFGRWFCIPFRCPPNDTSKGNERWRRNCNWSILLIITEIDGSLSWLTADSQIMWKTLQ